MSNVYEANILEWSEHQTALLRRVAAGERLNGEDLDWSHIIKEIESVGREQLHSVERLPAQALVHMLKAETWPLPTEVPGWQAEARRFRDDAASRFAPSMRQYISMPKINARALRAVPETIDGQLPLPIPSECPVSLEKLLNSDG